VDRQYTVRQRAQREGQYCVAAAAIGDCVANSVAFIVLRLFLFAVVALAVGL
jgi:hypothetical protein